MQPWAGEQWWICQAAIMHMHVQDENSILPTLYVTQYIERYQFSADWNFSYGETKSKYLKI